MKWLWFVFSFPVLFWLCFLALQYQNLQIATGNLELTVCAVFPEFDEGIYHAETILGREYVRCHVAQEAYDRGIL